MSISTLTITMPNVGFRSPFVASGSKALLVTAVLDTERPGCILDIVVAGIPLTAIKMLERQNIWHYTRDELPANLLA